MDRTEFTDLCVLFRYRFLKGRSIPGKVLLTRRPDPTPEPISPTYHRSLSENDAGRNERSDNPVEVNDFEFSSSSCGEGKLRELYGRWKIITQARNKIIHMPVSYDQTPLVGSSLRNKSKTSRLVVDQAIMQELWSSTKSFPKLLSF